MFNQEDIKQLQSKGISLDKAHEQMRSFHTGFPYLIIKDACNTENGIMKVGEPELASYLDKWDSYLSGTKKIVKFVPASGAATRMFKDLFEFVDGASDVPSTPFIQNFFSNIKQFAFYADLDACCFELYAMGIETLMAAAKYKDIITALLSEKGLNYGNLPKGLLKFHNYTNDARTPVEEHLSEGALYATNSLKDVNIHFTVSAEHRALFEKLTEEKGKAYEAMFDCHFNLSFSEQKPSTDTLAADEENLPFREDGKLVFRPGGHGALIENLNDIDADVIFIKNIDNVVPDSFKESTTLYKKVIAGILVSLQEKMDEYLQKLNSGQYSTNELVEMVRFLHSSLYTRNPETKQLEDGELAIYLKNKFNRPLRVCGMVKNEGEPGGGPFLTFNPDGSYSLQILEGSQINMNDVKATALMKESTHFNPVDLVCSVRNYKGDKFDLNKYVDKNCGFISHKSKGGRSLKALELPGLWNGAMSDWNTVFVEVPVSTFNPVKTVNDLLRKEHQSLQIK